MSRVIEEYLQRASELSASGKPFVTITLVHPEGHVPQDIGAKCIVTDSGGQWGTVGGGRLEARGIEHAKEMIARLSTDAPLAHVIAPELVRYELQRDLGMVCGGAATLFYELSCGRTWNIAVFGAGHVAQATVALLATLHCNVQCIDPRAEWIAKFPSRTNVQCIVCAEPAGYVARVPRGAFCLCLSQGHATDLPIVREILMRNEFAFLGVIGSEKKASTLRSTLIKEGFDAQRIDAIHCPVGLSIGSNSPAEIAISIGAQLLQWRDKLNTKP